MSQPASTPRRDWTRRDLLRAGAVGCLGLPQLSRWQQANAGSGRPAADACILVYCWGAPSQFEILDPKPAAPAEIRGEFGVTRSHMQGVVLGENIPKLAACSDRYAIVRTCQQSSTSHQPGAYEALTGFAPTANSVQLQASSSDYPNVGSVVAKLAQANGVMPPFVTLPQMISDVGNLTPGQFAGYLGKQYEPLAVKQDPNAADFNVSELSLPASTSLQRLEGRRALLDIVNRQAKGLEEHASVQSLDTFQERALSMLTSPKVKRAFDLSREAATLREQYGRNTYGQSCLLARRLVESGVKLVTVFSANNGKTPQHAWDTHSNNFKKLKNEMLPPFDQGTAALIHDLHQRGLARRTLLVVMSEFGRSPNINKNAGRDHWAKCYSIMMMGAGVKPGQVHGESDSIGAHPSHGRVFHTSDILATIYERLGINHEGEFHDPTGRPLPITRGKPMIELF